MTIVTLDRKEVESKIGKITPEVENKISMFGTPVEVLTESEISFDVSPNRPDLLSLSGFARAMNSYLNNEKPKKYEIRKPEKDYKVKIEKAVKLVRPFTVCAIVKNLKFNDTKIKEIIDIQEKIHLTLGRKRKKLAIGIYPLEKIKLPITFTAKKPEDINFIPLESDKAMNGRQILSRHPAGREYAHLLKDAEVFPVFVDGNKNVLSMPPIINSHETGKITELTKELFIECSGFNLYYLQKTLDILVTALIDMGGEVYAMEVEDTKKFNSPDLSEDRVKFNIKDINKTLGLNLSEKEVKTLLGKMNIGYEFVKGESFALIPAYRTDILHWIDLTEEIGIAYGYDNFESEIPKISTIAEETSRSIKKRLISEILSGLGLLECSSLHLSTKEDIKKMYFDFNEFIEIESSKTEYNVLRIDILNNLLKVVSENSDSGYPQKIFEIGESFNKNPLVETGIQEKDNLAIAIVDEKANFTEVKMVLDYLFKMLGLTYSLEPINNQNYILGRCGKIIIDSNSGKKEIGLIGEIAPRVLSNFKIKMPIAALELNLDNLF